MKPIPGERVWPNMYGKLRLPENGYGRDMRGRLWVRPPGGDSCTVEEETVIEHADDTVTTTSAVNGAKALRLVRGMWVVSNIKT
jgi:hypothetical protein